MSTYIIDGKSIAARILSTVQKDVEKLKKQSITPKLGVIFVGAHKPSQTYIRRKQEAAERVGIDFELFSLPASISKNDIIEKIKEVQSDKNLSGLIVQLPLPEPLYTTEVLNAIDPARDVDCLTNMNIGKLVMETHSLVPPTPGAVMVILKELDIDPAGKNITIIGMGALVGKPLAIILSNAQASITSCNSLTKDIQEKCLQADIIVSCVGKKNLLRGDMVREGAIVIDTGIVYENGVMYGDAAFEEVIQKASSITPTPGGVGPITVALLLHNTVICTRR